MDHFLAPLLRLNALPTGLRNRRTGQMLASELETAFDSASRRRGLLGRDGLHEGAALVIAPCGAVHTFFMRFPIDVVYASRDGRVVKTRSAVPPCRVSAALGAFAVIELPAGVIERSGTRPGDSLEIVALDPVVFFSSELRLAAARRARARWNDPPAKRRFPCESGAARTAVDRAPYLLRVAAEVARARSLGRASSAALLAPCPSAADAPSPYNP